MMFFSKKTAEKKTYDRETQKPVLKCSICNGEQVAGFKEIKGSGFTEVMLIRTNADLNAFREMYGIEGEIEKIY